MAASTPQSYSTDPALYLYTSLSSGSSKIVTATTRLSAILKANKVPYKALDVATDEKARMLWGRRAGKRTLPGLVKQGMVVADLDEVEEWNEYGEVRENLLDESEAAASPAFASKVAASAPPPPPPVVAATTSSNPAVTAKSTTSDTPNLKTSISSTPTSTSTTIMPESSRSPPPGVIANPMQLALRQAGFEAAKKASDAKAKAKAAAAIPLAAKEATKEGGDLSKLDNSGPAGTPPPTGTTSAEDAKTPDTGAAEVVSKSDKTPITGVDGAVESKETSIAEASAIEAKGPESPLQQSEPKVPTTVPSTATSDTALLVSENAISSSTSLPLATAESSSSPTYNILTHRGSNISAASAEEIKQAEEANLIKEEPEAEHEVEDLTPAAALNPTPAPETAMLEPVCESTTSPALSSTVAEPILIPMQTKADTVRSSKPSILEPAVMGKEKDKHIRFAGSPEPANKIVAASIAKEAIEGGMFEEGKGSVAGVAKERLVNEAERADVAAVKAEAGLESNAEAEAGKVEKPVESRTETSAAAKTEAKAETKAVRTVDEKNE